MIRALKFGVAAILAAGVFATLSSPQAFADKKHDSNTLHKIGNAIQYPVRKAGENLAIDTHRAEGRKSVAHTNQGHNVVITPQGSKYVIHHRYAHHRYVRHRRHHRVTHRTMRH
ncbi:MAG TPA: hypothetical protein VFW40_08270 [Capsulimonadaceae bacterium]|nr:hypothetical protein [Capsulimonadaceae bacterium]